jgi:hypothetical protein
MHADFSVELGRDDAALELPWNSADAAVRYCDLKRHPELLRQIPEAVAYPELGAFLTRINAAEFPLVTAKCDAWASREVAPEEEIFGDRKFVSYIDLVFEDEAARCSFEKHEAFAKNLCRLLSQTPEIPAAVEVVIRRCYYHGEGALPEFADEAGAGEKADGEDITVEAAASEAGAAGRDAVEIECEAEDEAGAEEDVAGAVEVEVELEGEDGAGAGADVAEEIVVSGMGGGSVSCFCFTTYVTGFGDSDHEPRLRWQIALALLQNALVQLTR